MLICILFFPLIILGSITRNLFIPLNNAPDGFGWENNEFIIPKYGFYLQAPGEADGLTIENVETIRTLLKNRNAKLGFEDFSSIKYFTMHILQPKNISDPIAQTFYENYFIHVSMKPVFPHSQKTHADSENLKPLDDFKPMPHKINIPSLLLKALEETSNEVEIDDVNNFFLTVKEKFDILKKNTSDGHWNRLKKAYRFFWDTFKMTGKDFSPKQTQEYADNKFYIRLVERAFLIPLITCCLFALCLSHVCCNNIEKKLHEILNKK